MIRKQILALALASLCSIAHASAVKDTGRVVTGTAIGAAGMAAAQAVCNAGKMIIWDGAWDSENFPGLDYQMIRVSAAIGGTVGLMNTTYLRTLRAQWDLWWSSSSERLINIAMREYETEEELVAALENYFTAHAYPLVAAKRELSAKLVCLQDAADLIEKALEDIADDSLRAEKLNDWLDEIYTMRAYVTHALKAIEKDTRLLTLMEAQNRIDQTNALWGDPVAQIAAAIIY
jgi:hypothetical protein